MVSLCITDDAVFPMGYKRKRWQCSNLKDIQWRMWYLFGSTTIACGVNDPLCFRYGTSGNRQVQWRLEESAYGTGYDTEGSYLGTCSMEGKGLRARGGILSLRYFKGEDQWPIGWLPEDRGCGEGLWGHLCYGGVQYVSFLTSYFTSGLVSHGDYHIVHSMMAARS